MEFKEIFNRVPPQISNYFAKKEYNNGAIIIDSNVEHNCFYIIISGSVEIYKQGYNGNVITIREFGSYSYFGEMEIFNKEYQPLTVKAITDCTIYRLDGNKLREWILKEPELGILLIEELAKRLSETSKMRFKLSLMTIKERLLHSLYCHYKLGDINKVSKKMLCNEISAPIRSLNRTINECMSHGYIEYSNKIFSISNLDYIQKVVEEF